MIRIRVAWEPCLEINEVMGGHSQVEIKVYRRSTHGPHRLETLLNGGTYLYTAVCLQHYSATPLRELLVLHADNAVLFHRIVCLHNLNMGSDLKVERWLRETGVVLS